MLETEPRLELAALGGPSKPAPGGVWGFIPGWVVMAMAAWGGGLETRADGAGGNVDDVWTARRDREPTDRGRGRGRGRGRIHLGAVGPTLAGLGSEKCGLISVLFFSAEQLYTFTPLCQICLWLQAKACPTFICKDERVEGCCFELKPHSWASLD